MQKIMIVTPHLSTGGLPQYLLYKLRDLVEHCHVVLVEYQDLGSFDVQKKQILELPNLTHITLGTDKLKLSDLLKELVPDLVHFEEQPERFCDPVLAEAIYARCNALGIPVVETCHTSRTVQKKCRPDAMIAVSEYSLKQHAGPSTYIPGYVYPYKPKDKLIVPHSDDQFLHILQVGLFAPWKNQALTIEAAKLALSQQRPWVFHFVGNMAGNFQNYWESLKTDIDSLANCVFHGELGPEQLEKLYMTADVLVHPSTEELAPLVIPEARSYGLPVVATMLDSYGPEIMRNQMITMIPRDGSAQDLYASLDNALIVSRVHNSEEVYNPKYSPPAITPLHYIYEDVIRTKKITGSPTPPTHDPVGMQEKLEQYKNQLLGDDGARAHVQNMALAKKPAVQDADIMTPDVVIEADFVGCPRVHIRKGRGRYIVMFDDAETGVNIHRQELVYDGVSIYAEVFKKYFIQWRITVWQNGEIVFLHEYNPRGRKVFIPIISSSLGDNIAFMPWIEEWRLKHQPGELIVSTNWAELFESEYPEITFCKPEDKHFELYAMYRLEWADPADRDIHPQDLRLIPLGHLAANVLGIKPKYDGASRAKARLRVDHRERPAQKFAAICTDSTAVMKHWLFPGGWQQVVDHIVSTGLEVRVYGQKKSTLKNVTDKTSNKIRSQIAELKNATYYVGLASGMSWVADALDVPVIMISGFSKPYTEFEAFGRPLPAPGTCTGCWNDLRFNFDINDGLWCPKLRNTERQHECSKLITPQQVIACIDQVPLSRP